MIFGKIFIRKSFADRSAIARASPIAIWAVVEDVGARLFGSASLLTGMYSRTSASRARTEFLLETMPMILFPIVLKKELIP